MTYNVFDGTLSLAQFQKFQAIVWFSVIQLARAFAWRATGNSSAEELSRCDTCKRLN